MAAQTAGAYKGAMSLHRSRDAGASTREVLANQRPSTHSEASSGSPRHSVEPEEADPKNGHVRAFLGTSHVLAALGRGLREIDISHPS